LASFHERIRFWEKGGWPEKVTTLSPYHLFTLLLLLTACQTEPTPPPPLPEPEVVLGTAVPAMPEVESPEPAYPPPLPTPTAKPYVAPPTLPPSATAVVITTPVKSATSKAFLPAITNGFSPRHTYTPTPIPATATFTPTPIPTLDFTAVRNDLIAQGQDLATVKIGFHVGVGGNSEGLEEWMRRLDEAGIPFFLKSADNAQPILFAQELKKNSGVPHVLVFRKTTGGDYDWDVPNYDLPAEVAAEQHWQMHRDAFPPELDPDQVWLETINEVDKNEAEWLGQFALKTAELALGCRRARTVPLADAIYVTIPTVGRSKPEAAGNCLT